MKHDIFDEFGNKIGIIVPRVNWEGGLAALVIFPFILFFGTVIGILRSGILLTFYVPIMLARATRLEPVEWVVRVIAMPVVLCVEYLLGKALFLSLLDNIPKAGPNAGGVMVLIILAAMVVVAALWAVLDFLREEVADSSWWNGALGNIIRIMGIFLVAGLTVLFVQSIPVPTSPEVQAQQPNAQVGVTFPTEASCPGTRAKRLEVGMTARVTYTDGTPNILRSGPGKTFGRIASMLEGTQMKVIGGPACASGYWYWQVQTSRFGIGWTAEGDANSYWLEPMPDQR